MFEAHPRSSGVLSPIIEAYADLDGAALPVGQSGEIWLRA
jgi:long-chain acyl-CoA synthetase